jgi:hypothetical protein
MMLWLQREQEDRKESREGSEGLKSVIESTKVPELSLTSELPVPPEKEVATTLYMSKFVVVMVIGLVVLIVRRLRPNFKRCLIDQKSTTLQFSV